MSTISDKINNYAQLLMHAFLFLSPLCHDISGHGIFWKIYIQVRSWFVCISRPVQPFPLSFPFKLTQIWDLCYRTWKSSNLNRTQNGTCKIRV